MSQAKRRVLIVTPTFNSEKFLDETIYSVIGQSGEGVDLLYHIQDGGSRDGTVDILETWSRRIARGDVPVLCDSLTFTYASERDDGMYDALNRGFARLAPEPSDLLTWINSDDRLNMGAVSTVCAAVRDVPECRFLSGRVALMNEEGAVVTIAGPRSYPRVTLAAGLHDGRRELFVMQEGTCLVLPDGCREPSGADLASSVAALFGDPNLRRRIGVRCRALVEAEWSLKAMAAHLRRAAAAFSGLPVLSDHLRHCEHLQVGPVPVRSGAARGLDPAALTETLGFRLTAVGGARAASPGPATIGAPFSMLMTADEAMLAINLLRGSAERLELLFTGRRPESWQVRLNEAEVMVEVSDATEVCIVLSTSLKFGLNYPLSGSVGRQPGRRRSALSGNRELPFAVQLRHGGAGLRSRSDPAIAAFGPIDRFARPGRRLALRSGVLSRRVAASRPGTSHRLPMEPWPHLSADRDDRAERAPRDAVGAHGISAGTKN